MEKKLTRHGNSLALVIEKPILELLQADTNTPFEVTTDGYALILTPILERTRHEAFRTALEEANTQYGGALKKLAE